MEMSFPVRKTVVLKPISKMVNLLSMTFYDIVTTKSDQQKSASIDRGIAVVVLDALQRWQWVREEYLANFLRLHAEQLQKILRHFEEQNLIIRDRWKETATTDGRATKDKGKLLTHSYCCLNYQQMCDNALCKLHRIKQKLKDKLEVKSTVNEYGCPNWQRKYNALDALRLIYMEDDSFHCENCNGELSLECKKLTSEELAVGDDTAERRGRENYKDWLQMMEVQLEPLIDEINRLKDLGFPKLESLHANGDLNPNDPSRSQGGFDSSRMPFLRETQVEVNFGNEQEDAESGVLPVPPWIIREGLNLTIEQREAAADDKDFMDAFRLQEEYLKAYYTYILNQREGAEKSDKQESAGDIQVATKSSDRQVGMKSKREEEDEDVEWEEEAPVAANGYYKGGR